MLESRDAIIPLYPDDSNEAPKFTVTLTNGTNVVLNSGSAFPMDALPTTELLVVVTKASGQAVPVLCETTWGELKDLIDDMATKPESELESTLANVFQAVNATNPAAARRDPQQFADYLADLTIVLVIMRQLKGTKIHLLQGNDKELVVAQNIPFVYLSTLVL